MSEHAHKYYYGLTPLSSYSLVVQAALDKTWDSAIEDPLPYPRFDLHLNLNSCYPPYNSDSGWGINFENPQWNDDTIVVLHMQDFVTVDPNHTSIELLKIQNYYREKANRVIVLHWQYGIEKFYTGPLNLVYFPSHSWEILNNIFKHNCIGDWERHFENPRRSKNWQCLNGCDRTHRRLLAKKLNDYNLIDFSGVNSIFPTGYFSYNTLIALPQHDYSTYSCVTNEENFLRLHPIYTDSIINIVAETQYFEEPGIITEKTIFAFMARQIPLVIGYKGIVRDLEELGFDMFRDVIDTTYDLEDNDYRISLAIKNNLHLLQEPFDAVLYEELKPRLEANFERLKGYADWCYEKLYSDLIDARIKISKDLGLV